MALNLEGRRLVNTGHYSVNTDRSRRRRCKSTYRRRGERSGRRSPHRTSPHGRLNDCYSPRVTQRERREDERSTAHIILSVSITPHPQRQCAVGAQSIHGDPDTPWVVYPSHLPTQPDIFPGYKTAQT